MTQDIRYYINLVEATLNERAATPTGMSKYIGKSGQVYYISHRTDHNMVQCGAYAAATNPFQPIREKVGVASCTMADKINDLQRNNVRVYSSKSVVDPQHRREGLLNAMYDHLDAHGFVVYPADGSIGDAKLQAQTGDAQAFWASRHKKTHETKLLPVSEAEFYGWGKFNPFAKADSVTGLPVLEKLPLHGNQHPMLVLWKKAFSTGDQRVGVMYDTERGYRIVVMTGDPMDKYGYEHDFPYVYKGDVKFHYPAATKKPKASTLKVITTLADTLDRLRVNVD